MYKNKKKVISILLIFLVILGFSFFLYYNSYINNWNINQNSNSNTKEIGYNGLTKENIKEIVNGTKILVAVSVIPQSEFVENIGKEKVITITMIPIGSNHNYDPCPKQLEDLSRAKIYMMLNSGEPFEEKYIYTFQQLNSKMKIIDCSKSVPLIIKNGKKDPHVWMSPKMVILMIENIYNGLISIDPNNNKYYTLNKDIYILKLENLDKKIEQILLSKKNRSFIVYHPAWSYFARDYNLNQIPIEYEGKEPTPKYIKNLIISAKKDNINVVFVQEQINKKVAESIAREINGNIVSLNPMAKNYIENMEYMIEIINNNMT